jgi:hypothetical protein
MPRYRIEPRNEPHNVSFVDQAVNHDRAAEIAAKERFRDNPGLSLDYTSEKPLIPETGDRYFEASVPGPSVTGTLPSRRKWIFFVRRQP